VPNDTRAEITTLCGSTRFPTAHKLAMMHLTMMGRVVIPCGILGHADTPPGAQFLCDDGNELNEHKQELDSLHNEKILRSDGIFVVNVAGCVGDSTRREIQYAQDMGKKIEWMFPDAVPDWWMSTETAADTKGSDEDWSDPVSASEEPKVKVMSAMIGEPTYTFSRPTTGGDVRETMG
jgi:hypothetical protein